MPVIYDTNTVTFLHSTTQTIFFSNLGRFFSLSFVAILNYNSLILQKSGLRLEIFFLALDVEFPEDKNFFFSLIFFFSYFFTLCKSNLPLTHKHSNHHGVIHIVLYYGYLFTFMDTLIL